MRSKIAGLTLGLVVAVAAVFTARDARAEQEFDVAVAGGKVTVTAKGGWHINLEYPWKLQQDGKTVAAKDKFSLNKETAVLSNAPHGAAKLKGAVCSGDKCKTFEKDLTL
jgi:predicted membrane-bound mannosyltransferase